MEFFPAAAMARLTGMRVSDPEFASRAAQARRRRPRLAPDGRLNILAADHPARRVTRVAADPLAMADRRDYLARILRVMMAPGVDGLMATMDILEDLLAIDAFVRAGQGDSLLDGKVLIASLNRGGLAGSAWELDDPVTGASPAAVAAWKLDGAKFLLRIADEDPGSLRTMQAAAEAITALNALGLPMFLEPLPVARTEKGWTVLKEPAPLARVAGVASALGDSSRFLWLKLPYCPNYETVARATSLPILLLGGESAGGPAPFLTELVQALEAGPNVRGALVGRNVLYPGPEDPLAMAAAVGAIVHRGATLEQALEAISACRGQEMDRIARYL
jgi:hypothetical protein